MRQRTSRTVRPSEQKELIESMNDQINGDHWKEIWGHYGMGTSKSVQIKVGKRLFRVTDHDKVIYEGKSLKRASETYLACW